MRESHRVHCRLTMKNNMLQERRKRFMDDSNVPVQIQLNEDQLPADYLQHLIQQKNVEQIGKLLRQPSNKIKNAFKQSIKQLMDFLKEQMGGQNHMSVLRVLGALFSLGRDAVTYDDVGDNLTYFLIDRVLTCQIKQANVIFWVLSQLVSIVQKPQLLLRLSSQYNQIWQRSPTQQFTCLLSSIKQPILQPSAALLENILSNCFNSQQKQQVLMDILRIVDNYLKKVVRQQASQPFLYNLLNFIKNALCSTIPSSIKPQLIELVGLVISVNDNDLHCYFFQNSLLDQLLFRSKIDVHNNKVAAINSLVTALLHCNQAAYLDKFIKAEFDRVLVDSLDYHQAQLVFMALKGNARLLEMGQKEKLRKLRLQSKLERLQTHPNPIVYQIVEGIIDYYFSSDFI